jgi:hypothetical protein
MREMITQETEVVNGGLLSDIKALLDKYYEIRQFFRDL